jgi:hypothetical protein
MNECSGDPSNYNATCAFHASGTVIADPGHADLGNAKVARAVERVIVVQAMWLGDVFCQVHQRVTSPRGKAKSLDHDLEFVLKVIESRNLTAIALGS